MSRVQAYAASNLHYVGEAKLARLSDADLLELHRLLVQKHGGPAEPLPEDKTGAIKAILDLKVKIGILSKTEADKAEAAILPPVLESPPEEEAPIPKSNPLPHEEHDAQVSAEEQGEEEEKAVADAVRTAMENIKQSVLETAEKEEEEDVLSKAAAEFEKMFIKDENTDPAVLAAEEEANKARANAFVQLVAAASPPEPPPEAQAPPPIEPAAPEDVLVDKHRLRICSFNALKLRLGSANKSYDKCADTSDTEGYEGTQKGAELTQKWLTLSARMADFDVILMQEVPGSEKLLDERMSTFAAMLQLATPANVEWTALPSEKSGKDGKVVGPGAECHVCFVKAPVQLRDFGTLKKVGCTELDYAPLQVALHDPRFEDPADRDFVVTSVHMPPSPRVNARDTQIAALLRNYSAPDTSEYRLQMPWGLSKRSERVPVHVIAGDWNAFPGNEHYDMAANGFINKIPKQAATTVGHKHYDNVLVDTRADERFLIGGGILQLKAAKEEDKAVLSDHWPVFVEIVEVRKTGRGPSSPTPPEAAPSPENATPEPPAEASLEPPNPDPDPEPAPADDPTNAPSDATEADPPPSSTAEPTAEAAAEEAEVLVAPLAEPPLEEVEEEATPPPPTPPEADAPTLEAQALRAMQLEEQLDLAEELETLSLLPERPETPAPDALPPMPETMPEPLLILEEVD